MPTVLIVDDEPLVCEMLEVALQRAGYTVFTASDGVQAITLVKNQPIDLVVADIVMPEKDGLETIQELLKNNPKAKIIAISGGSRIGNFDFLEIARKFGAVETFYKPLNNKLLLEAIEKHLKVDPR